MRKLVSCVGLSIGLLSAAVSIPVYAIETIKVAVASNTTTLDPVKSAYTPMIMTYGQLYSRLLRLNKSGELEAGLAKSWTVSEDGLEYTFQLRDSKFSDGSKLTAADVKFSLDRVSQHKETAYPATLAMIDSITVVDDLTVNIKLKYPSGPFISNLEVFNAAIVSKNSVETNGEKIAFENPIASGPFMVREWRKNDRIIFERNPHYWREGYPKSDVVEYIQVEDVNARVSMLRAQQVDAIESAPYSMLKQLAQNPKINVPLNPTTKTNIVLLNHDRAPFDNIKVRQAAYLALNTAAIAKVVTRGLVTKAANTTLPGSLSFHDKSLSVHQYDVAAAKKLLDEAGAVGAEVEMIMVSGDLEAEHTALIIQSQWAAIGLKAKVIKLDSAAYAQRRNKDRNWNAIPAWYYNETLDPDLAVRWAVCGSCGSNSFHTKYNNEQVNALTEQGSSEIDATKRAKIYSEIQRISTQEVAHIPLFYPPYTHAYSTRIKGLKMTPALQWTLEDAEVVNK